MSKYFVRDTSLAELERMMMEVPNFAPRRSSRTVLCRYHPQEADMDCHSCHHYRRNGSGNLACLHLTERLQAGMVTMDELTAGMVRPWKHSRLKKRAMEIARRTGGFHFKEQLHIARMLKMTEGEASVNSRWRRSRREKSILVASDCGTVPFPSTSSTGRRRASTPGRLARPPRNWLIQSWWRTNPCC